MSTRGGLDMSILMKEAADMSGLSTFASNAVPSELLLPLCQFFSVGILKVQGRLEEAALWHCIQIRDKTIASFLFVGLWMNK